MSFVSLEVHMILRVKVKESRNFFDVSFHDHFLSNCKGQYFHNVGKKLGFIDTIFVLGLIEVLLFFGCGLWLI